MQNNRPIRTWPGTIILRCPPCSWGRCVFCGFSKDCLTHEQPTKSDLIQQLGTYYPEYGIPDHLEIFNSGSFLDAGQISSDAQIAVFEDLEDKGVQSVAIESRPEFVTLENLAPLSAAFKGDLTVAIGLEVADNDLLRKLQKGFDLHDVERACGLLKQMEISSRVYILVGAPFVDDAKTVTLDSVKWAKKIGFDEVCLLAAYPMEGSAGYKLWRAGKWSPIRLKEFDEIVALAGEVDPELDFSSHGLETFSLSIESDSYEQRAP